MKLNSHHFLRTKNDRESIHSLPFEYDPTPLKENEGYFYTRGMEREMNLNQMANEFYRNAKTKGFYEEINELMLHPNLTEKQKKFIEHLWYGHRLMLIVSELGEALEGLRHGNMSTDPKSGGFCEELADAQIRLGDLSVDVGFDLENTVMRKHEYNQTREVMHGKKS